MLISSCISKLVIPYILQIFFWKKKFIGTKNMKCFVNFLTAGFAVCYYQKYLYSFLETSKHFVSGDN